MAIKIGDNFSFQGKSFNFERDSFPTKLEMKNYPETSVPDGFLTYCEEDKNYYIFHDNNTNDDNTGKWSLFITDTTISGDALNYEKLSNKPLINSVELSGNKASTELKIAGIFYNGKGEIFNDYQNNAANGTYSHAEGNSSKAVGIASHAEGCETLTNGFYSHAEGYKSKSEGQFSHAEGNSTVANEDGSHAEGNGTSANGRQSHAEGLKTVADGGSAHAEGSGTNAIGNASHAEGISVSASGSASHAEGRNTIANNEAEHAEGKYNVSNTGSSASAQTIHSVGIGTSSTRKNAFEIMSNGDIYVNGVGGYDGINYNSATTLQTKLNNIIGQITIENGEIFNNYTGNTATGNYSHAEGTATSASGTASHAEGFGSKSSGTSSHAEGYLTSAIGDYSHAEGAETRAYTSYSHAEGNKSIASGESSHAEGFASTSSGNYSHAEGNFTSASGTASHAEGNLTKSISNYSHAEGNQTITSGLSSHAEGTATNANGRYSHTEGFYTVANNEAEHAEGKYNVSSTGSSASAQTIHSVGIGTSSIRKNAFEIMSNGDMYVNGVGGYDGTNYNNATTLQNSFNKNGTFSINISNGNYVIGINETHSLLDTITFIGSNLQTAPSSNTSLPFYINENYIYNVFKDMVAKNKLSREIKVNVYQPYTQFNSTGLYISKSNGVYTIGALQADNLYMLDFIFKDLTCKIFTNTNYQNINGKKAMSRFMTINITFIMDETKNNKICRVFVEEPI